MSAEETPHFVHSALFHLREQLHTHLDRIESFDHGPELPLPLGIRDYIVSERMSAIRTIDRLLFGSNLAKHINLDWYAPPGQSWLEIKGGEKPTLPALIEFERKASRFCVMLLHRHGFGISFEESLRSMLEGHQKIGKVLHELETSQLVSARMLHKYTG